MSEIFTERKIWRVIKVEYIESKLTFREAQKIKRKLNSDRNRIIEPYWKIHYRTEKMEEYI